MLKHLINESIELLQYTDTAKLALLDIWLDRKGPAEDLADALATAIGRHSLTPLAIASGDHGALANKCQVPVEIMDCIARLYLIRKSQAENAKPSKRPRATQEHSLIKTHIEEIDELFKGGLKCCEITELFGVSGSYKTQLTLNITCNALLNNENLKVIWIDSGNSGFLVDRAKSILQHNQEKMSKFMYHRIHTLSGIMNVLTFLLQHHEALGESRLLVVVDCMTQAAWASFSDWDKNSSIHGDVMREISGLLKKMSSDLNACVLLTNNSVKDNIDEEVSLHKRALGKLCDVSDNILECKVDDDDEGKALAPKFHSEMNNFNLPEELLKLKEALAGNLDQSQLQTEINVLELSPAAQEKKLDEAFDAFEEDCSLKSEGQFWELKSFAVNFDSLGERVQNKCIQTLLTMLKLLVTKTNEELGQGKKAETDLEQLRITWETLVFVVFWILCFAERKSTAKVGSTLSKPIGKGKKKPNKSEKEDKNNFDWQARKSDVLSCFEETLQLPLAKIWPLLHQRAPFMSMFMDTVNLMFETEANVKDHVFKAQCVQILTVCICQHGQSQGFQTTLIQNLRYSTFLADLMADILTASIEKSDISDLIDVIFTEIGQSKFTTEDKTAKEFSKFLIRFASQCPRECLKSLSLVMDLIDSDAYNIRCAMIELLGAIMSKIAIAGAEESDKNQAISLCMVLEERLLDISSYVRGKVLKTFHSLIELMEDSETGASRIKNAIPLSRRLHIVESAIDRLHDKVGTVRKEAIRLLTRLIETHPFWLDGGMLDLGLFESRKADLQKRIESMVPEDIISALTEALPDIAKEALKLDNPELLPKEKDPNKIYSSPEEIEKVQKQLIYYGDAIRFTKQMSRASKIISELLASKAKADVVESIDFFVEARRHNLAAANEGLRKMVHLIWSKDVGDNESKSIKEHLLQAYSQLYLEVYAADPKDEVKKIVKNLIMLTFNSTLAELTSLEQLMSTLMSREMISEEVIHHLWSIYGSAKSEMPAEQRRGAIIVLGMLAKDNVSLLKDHVSLMLKIGFGEHAKKDLQIARYTCIALQKIGYKKQRKIQNAEIAERLENDNVIFAKLKAFLLDECKSLDWLMFCEQAVNMIYALADQPDIICSIIIKKLTQQVFFVNEDNAASNVQSIELAKLLFLVGHVAIKQIAHLEVVESELKDRDSSTKDKKKTEKEELDDVACSVEDDVADQIQFIRENELLFGSNGIIAQFGPMIAHICSNNTVYKNPLLFRMAVLSLCKLMCVSEKFAEQHLSLLFAILSKSHDISTRSNAIIGVGDLAVCFSNLIDQNISFLYDRLRDSNREVKKNALMVLTHLILNGMVKVKGQIGEMALCIEDEDERIADMAKLFFTELAAKDNSIYNNLPDIISALSLKRGSASLTDAKYNSIMKFLLAFIEKDKQSENITEKLCQRFKSADSVQVSRDLAYCLSLMQFKSEKSIKKLAEYFPAYQEQLFDGEVFNYFAEIINKSRKTITGENKLILDELETRLLEAHNMGQENENALKNASRVQTAGIAGSENILEEAKQALENFKITTPAKQKRAVKKAAASTAKKKPAAKSARSRVVAKFDDEDGDSDAENSDFDQLATSRNSDSSESSSRPNSRTESQAQMDQDLVSKPPNRLNQQRADNSSTTGNLRGKRANSNATSINNSTKTRKRQRANDKSNGSKNNSQSFDDFENLDPNNGRKSNTSAKSNASYQDLVQPSYDIRETGHPPTPNYDDDSVADHEEFASEAARAAQAEWQLTLENMKNEAGKKIDVIRNHITLRFTDATKRSIALHEFYQHWDKSQDEAAYAASLLVSVTPEVILEWKQEFEESSFYLPYDGAGDFRPAVRRTWLLEEYPDLLKKAQEWVSAEMAASIEKDGKLFRITEFQRWVNEILLAPLYKQSKKQITPISHSTARSWLNRLGYYAELKRLEEARDAENFKRVSEAFNQLPLSTQGGKFTWTPNALPNAAMNSPFSLPNTAATNVDSGESVNSENIAPVDITTAPIQPPPLPIPIPNTQPLNANVIMERLRQVLAQRGQNPNIVLAPSSLAQIQGFQAVKYPQQMLGIPHEQMQLPILIPKHNNSHPTIALSEGTRQPAIGFIPKMSQYEPPNPSTSLAQKENEQDPMSALFQIPDPNALLSGDDNMLS